MKKNLFMVAAVALMAMASCNKMADNNGGDGVFKPSVIVEFVASVDATTKTTLNAGKTEWLVGDEISINGVKFVTEEAGESVRFTNIDELPEDFKEPYTAIYPYNATKGIAEVKSTQTVSGGTFADDVVVSVAYAETGNVLGFKHVSSVIKFNVATAGVKELTFSSETSDLAGTINVNADASYTVVEGAKTITVKPANGTFDTAETYYVSVLPTLGSTKKDFTVTLDGTKAKYGDVVFKKNTIMNAGELAKETQWRLKGFVDNWGDGQILYEIGDYYVAKGISAPANAEYKFYFSETDKWYGSTYTSGKWTTNYTSVGGNAKITQEGKYDFYMLKNGTAYIVVKNGETVPAKDIVRIFIKKDISEYTFDNMHVYLWNSTGDNGLKKISGSTYVGKTELFVYEVPTQFAAKSTSMIISTTNWGRQTKNFENQDITKDFYVQLYWSNNADWIRKYSL